MSESGLFAAHVLTFDFENTSIRDGDGTLVGFSEQWGHDSILTVSDTSGELGWQVWDTSRKTFGHEWTVQGPDWGGGHFGKPRDRGYFIGDTLIAIEIGVRDFARLENIEFDVYDVGNACVAEIRLVPRVGWRSFVGRRRWEVLFLSPVDRQLRAFVCAAIWTHHVDLHDSRG